MTQVVEHLSSEHEALVQTLVLPKKKKKKKKERKEQFKEPWI
jgi:hypothetical protein